MILVPADQITIAEEFRMIYATQHFCKNLSTICCTDNRLHSHHTFPPFPRYSPIEAFALICQQALNEGFILQELVDNMHVPTALDPPQFHFFPSPLDLS